VNLHKVNDNWEWADGTTFDEEIKDFGFPGAICAFVIAGEEVVLWAEICEATFRKNCIINMITP